MTQSATARRAVFLDTETTGIEVAQGHRIIEIAAVEMMDRRLTGRHFHVYLNPDRDIDPGAQAVHGISREFLADKPRIAEIIDDFLTYIEGAELIIHNAAFDVGFLNHELAGLRRKPVTTYCSGVLDTLKMARDLHPGQRNSLDALCRRYGVDNSGRTLHGALLDAELLAEVYLAMTRGQNSLAMEEEPNAVPVQLLEPLHAGEIVVLAASPEELQAHAEQLDGIQKASRGACLWLSAEAVGTAK